MFINMFVNIFVNIFVKIFVNIFVIIFVNIFVEDILVNISTIFKNLHIPPSPSSGCNAANDSDRQRLIVLG